MPARGNAQARTIAQNARYACKASYAIEQSRVENFGRWSLDRQEELLRDNWDYAAILVDSEAGVGGGSWRND